jgi:RNA ligase
VTSKCRGVIITRGADGGEVVSRPFEKFHNYGEEPGWGNTTYLPTDEPIIWEKLDGFMCTLYTWEGVDYIASKRLFHSVYAKWATAWLRRKFGKSLEVPAGYTAVFEGLHRDLRIVVDYGLRQELVLLALINKETGEELPPDTLRWWAAAHQLSIPVTNNLSLEEARRCTMGEAQDGSEEGFVLTWYQNGKPPFRLKLKFVEYLRLHRLVTNVSPKHIWEVLRDGLTSEMDEYINNSTPGFAKFAQKWMKAMTAEYKRLESEAWSRYEKLLPIIRERTWDNLGVIRKAYALEVMKPENKEFASILFAMLDGKNVAPIIWQRVRPMTKDANPLVNGFD